MVGQRRLDNINLSARMRFETLDFLLYRKLHENGRAKKA